MKAKWMRAFAIASLTLAVITACAPSEIPETAIPDATLSPITILETSTPSSTLAPSSTPTAAPTSTDTPTVTPVPTYATLRGEVVADKLSCRYGPGAPYLYKYGLIKGNRLEIIGRREDGKWVYLQAIGGHNPCWVKAEFMQVQGDVMSLEVYYPEKAPLPRSPYYPPTDWVGATRKGNVVEVEWNDVPLRAGDEEDEFMQHYIVEVWRCEGGQLIFEPLATNDLAVTFIDEPGCSQPSHGRVFVQEKHGFAGPAEIPWPPYDSSATATPSQASP